MLPKKFRLNITSFYQNPQPAVKYSTGLLSLLVKTTTRTNHIAALVPKSLDKRSSYRIRTKRIILEAIQKKLSQFTCCADILIRSKKILKKEERLMVKKEVDLLFKKAGIL